MMGLKKLHTVRILSFLKNKMDIHCITFTLIICLVITITAAADIGGSGGEIIYEDGYTYHLFTEEDTFEPPDGINEVEVLIVAGGGGGGGAVTGAGGGGGAGGLINDFESVSSSVDVTVGRGGNGGQPGERGEDGANSSFGSREADGGGGGGSTDTNQIAGRAGGSGGGGGSGTATGGSTSSGDGIAGQGHDGGEGFRAGQSRNRSGGGGGGAEEPGVDAENRSAGDGGDGSYFEQFLNFGDNGYFAGGGGGGGDTAGSGGNGGGGSGQADTCGDGENAKPETGSGGGGAFCLIEEGFSGGNGADGIVIVRYPTIPVIQVEGDICFEIGAGDFGSVLSDDSSHLSWIGTGDNKITVEIETGEVPEGLELTVDSDRAEAETILTNTARNFITDIGEERIIDHTLTYRLKFIEDIIPAAGETDLTVKYTITDQ